MACNRIKWDGEPRALPLGWYEAGRWPEGWCADVKHVVSLATKALERESRFNGFLAREQPLGWPERRQTERKRVPPEKLNLDAP